MKTQATAIHAQRSSSTPFKSTVPLTRPVEILGTLNALEADSQALCAKTLLLQQLALAGVSLPTGATEVIRAEHASAPLARVCLKVSSVEAKAAALLTDQGSSELMMSVAFVARPVRPLVCFRTSATLKSI